MRKQKIFFLYSLCLLLFISSCGDDDPVLPGNLTITPSSASFSGVRGTSVDVSATVNADDGIQSVKATPSVGSEQTYTIPADATTFTATYTFDVPADAILNTEYSVTFEVVDKDGDSQTSDATVVAAALLSSNPTTYEFTRDGASTVSYSGQNERLDMVEAIKAYLKAGDGGAPLSATVLNDAFANTNGDGNGFFSFSSTKQLKNKTFQPDLDDQLMENLFDAAEAASVSGLSAGEGTAGLIVRENSGNTILVNEKGHEFTQFIEKGLMGTVMYNQIYNVYLTDARTGDDVENTDLREGNNYTDMEHHWDEAFGYWNPPLDFASNWPSERASEDRFWSHYSNTVDPIIGSNSVIMEAFIAGRTAIVNNDLTTKTAKRTEVSEWLELVAAATAIHYINDSQEALNVGEIGDAFHVMSEVWAFVNAIKYYPNRKLTLDQINEINEQDLGANGNFWNVTPEGLAKAKATLVAAYPQLEAGQDDL